jgi:hypothetical protein
MPYPDSTYEQKWRSAKVHPFQRARDPHQADLLAAAPELLAALRELVHYDEGRSEQGAYGYEVLSRCKAAIAKAEGRE